MKNKISLLMVSLEIHIDTNGVCSLIKGEHIKNVYGFLNLTAHKFSAWY